MTEKHLNGVTGPASFAPLSTPRWRVTTRVPTRLNREAKPTTVFYVYADSRQHACDRFAMMTGIAHEAFSVENAADEVFETNLVEGRLAPGA